MDDRSDRVPLSARQARCYPQSSPPPGGVGCHSVPRPHRRVRRLGCGRRDVASTHAIIHATGAARGTSSSERVILLSIIQAAGWPIWPLLICSIAALALIIERFSSLRLSRVAPARLLDE